jgi:hypothetical protein
VIANAKCALAPPHRPDKPADTETKKRAAMAALPVKLMLSAVGFVFVLTGAASADAKTRKHKKPEAHAAKVTVNSKYRGTDKFPAGPVYNGTDYLGDDPDPNIRFQIMRDLGAHYGGEP